LKTRTSWMAGEKLVLARGCHRITNIGWEGRPAKFAFL